MGELFRPIVALLPSLLFSFHLKGKRICGRRDPRWEYNFKQDL
jgi:hypothetical protein